MNVICHNCNAKLNIPDHKVPKDKDTTLKCPKCTEKIQIKATNQSKQVKGKKQKSFQSSFGDRLNALVLIGEDNLKKKAYSIIKQMGLNTETAENSKDATNRMEYHIYHLVIVDETFDGNIGISGIIGKMNTIDMSLRRRICLVSISNNYKTNDGMAAMHSSVNSIIHRDDIQHLEEFLSSALMDHKNFYTVYNDSLKLVRRA
ncbi:MAG: hypothetical protein GY699_06715 [Desulfobacteraceae bacterium]|nr:hypothetical protein [Desulfobacteraceae bacterium]